MVAPGTTMGALACLPIRSPRDSRAPHRVEPLTRNMSWLGDLLTRFRRDLPSFVGIWLIVLLGLMALDFIGGGTFGPLAIVVGWFLLAVALIPLRWLRSQVPVVSGRHATRRTLAAIGLAIVWAVVVLALGMAITGWLGIEW